MSTLAGRAFSPTFGRSFLPATVIAVGILLRAPAGAQVLYDNFDDNTTSTAAWVTHVAGTGPTIVETNQRVEITIPEDSALEPDPLGGHPQAGAVWSLKCRLRGDFDVQVDYSLLAWPQPPTAAAMQLFSFPSLPERGFSIGRGTLGRGQYYFAGVPPAPTLASSTSDLSGTFRLVRSASVSTAYYATSTGWVAVGSEQVSTSDLPIQLGMNVVDQPPPQLVRGAFDNFIVNQGELVGCSVCPDATAPGPMTQPKLTISKLQTPPGDDKLTFTGQLTLPSPFNPPLDPLANGVRLAIQGTASTVLDVTIPGGTFDTATKVGWKINGAQTKWTYQNKSTTPPGGIYKVLVQDKSSQSPGLVKFAVNGKAGSYAVAASELPLTARMILAPSGGKCGDTSFSTCAFNRSGSTLKCK